MHRFDAGTIAAVEIAPYFRPQPVAWRLPCALSDGFTIMNARGEVSPTRWRAHLRLRYDCVDGRTRLAQRRHSGPLCVQRAHYADDGGCHTHILHPPGGVVGGDELEIDVILDAAAQVLLTTPAAGKFYRSNGATAVQRQTITIRDNARCEWLPQESIFYAGAHVQSDTQVHLTAHAQFTGWEISCLGRPAAGEQFSHGDLRQRVALWRDGRLMFIERTHFAGGAPVFEASWGLNGASVTATLISTGHTRATLAAVRTILRSDMAATLIDDILICRYLGHDSHNARSGFSAVLTAIRAAQDRDFIAPRIW